MRPSDAKKARGCGCGLGLGIVGFVGFIIWLTMFSNSCARMMGIETYPLTGDIRHFEPFKEVSQIRRRAGTGAVLTKIDATYVRSDGTMDLQADYTPPPGVVYTFEVPSKAPDKVPPIGAGGRTADDVWFQTVRVTCRQVGQRKHVTRISGNSKSSFSYTNEGMEVDRGTPQSGKLHKDIGDPKRGCAELWRMALDKGAHKDAVAVIRMSDQGYDFSISGGISFRLNPDGMPR
jgi:hypothetical protein